MARLYIPGTAPKLDRRQLLKRRRQLLTQVAEIEAQLGLLDGFERVNLYVLREDDRVPVGMTPRAKPTSIPLFVRQVITGPGSLV